MGCSSSLPCRYIVPIIVINCILLLGLLYFLLSKH
jgi:hypothetical protein